MGVTATILSAGKAMDASYQVAALDIRKEVDRIPQAELRLLDGDSADRDFPISDSGFFAPGAKLEIKLRPEGTAQSADASVFKGIVVRNTIESSLQGSTLIVRCKDEAVKLTGSRGSELYEKLTDTEIIQKLVKDAGLTCGTIAETGVTHEGMMRYASTRWDFMLSRTDALGLLVAVNDGKVSVQKMEVTGSPVLQLQWGLAEILDFEMETDTEQQYDEVVSVGWDPKQLKLTDPSKAKSVSSPAGNPDGVQLGSLVGNKSLTLSHPVPLPPKELQSWADAYLARSRLSLLRGRVTLMGTAAVKVLDVVKVGGIGKRWNGNALVTGVRHRIDGGRWLTDLQLGLSSDRFSRKEHIVDAPAAGLLPAIGGLQLGVVADFTEDPDKELRVKVILPALDNQKPTAVWANLLTPDAGKDRGYFFRPEPKDEVVVGFLNDDPRRPVILGSLFGSKNAPPSAVGMPTAKNDKKAIVTKKGTTIAFDDGDKPSVFIQTPKNNKLLLSDDKGVITLSDQHGNSITMDQDGIHLKSAKKVTVDASADVAIKGSKVDIQ